MHNWSITFLCDDAKKLDSNYPISCYLFAFEIVRKLKYHKHCVIFSFQFEEVDDNAQKMEDFGGYFKIFYSSSTVAFNVRHANRISGIPICLTDVRCNDAGTESNIADVEV